MDATLSVYRATPSSMCWLPFGFGSRERPLRDKHAIGLLTQIAKHGEEAGFIIEGSDAEEAEARVKELLQEPLDWGEFQKVCRMYRARGGSLLA